MSHPDDQPHEHHSLIERLRGTGVGMEDPNIIGDAGPTDVAPGADPPLPPLDEDLPPEEETPAERALPSDGELALDIAEPADIVELVEVMEVVDLDGSVELVEVVEVVEVIERPSAQPE